MNEMPPRIIVRIEVPKQTWDQTGRLTEKYGMTQVSLHSRMIEWLSAQPDEIKVAVLSQVAGETQGTTARLILKNMQARASLRRKRT
jgi:hypothetical protein